MYQHPATLELMASYHQQELLREAEAHRLTHQEDEESNRPGQVQRRMIAVAAALVAVLAAIALI